MNTKDTFFLGALGILMLTACQSDDENVAAIQGETTAVKFELDASSLNHTPITRAYTPTYSKDGFSIYAFKQVDGGTDFIYNKTINLSAMTYDESTQKLTGSDNLPIGTYKFITAYGLANQPSVVSVLNWEEEENTPLTDELSMSYLGGIMSEVFLETGSNVADQTPYSLGLTDTQNETVSATLKRAVARVDIQFISATKVGETFVEKPYAGPDGNILGSKKLEQIQLRFTELNNAMTMFGLDATDGTFPQNLNLSDFQNTVVIGDGTATAVGTPGFYAYNNIQPSNIISGSAHIYGTYLFPNNDATKKAGLQIYIKPVGSEGRTITISKDDDTKLPLERNKVTIVKVYVLDDNNVFTTTVNFEVEIETVWEDPHQVTGSIN